MKKYPLNLKKIQKIFKEASKFDFITKFDYGFLYYFLHLGPKILHIKFQVISSKNEGVTAIIAILDFFIFLSKFGHGIPLEGPQ